MVRNPDGTPFKVVGSIQQFDPDSPDVELLSSFDAESIRIYGVSIFYHEVFISTPSIDPLYQESRSKVWSQNPVELFAYYEPIPSTNNLGTFGIDAPDEIAFELNYRDVLQKLGHPPKIGARIFTPHLRENWEIIQRNTGEYKMWNVFRLQLICRRFQESLTTGSGNVAENQLNFKII